MRTTIAFLAVFVVGYGAGFIADVGGVYIDNSEEIDAHTVNKGCDKDEESK